MGKENQGILTRAPQPEEMKFSFHVCAKSRIAFSLVQWEGATL